MADDVGEKFEVPARQAIVAHVPPVVLPWVQSRAFGRQRNQRNIRLDVQAAREMPAA